MLISKVDEIVAKAKEYIKKYNISERDAIECAIDDIEKEIRLKEQEEE